MLEERVAVLALCVMLATFTSTHPQNLAQKNSSGWVFSFLQMSDADGEVMELGFEAEFDGLAALAGATALLLMKCQV